MARFSIIIPLQDSTKRFEETLASALRYRPENSQIIVVHSGSYDDPYGLEKEVDFQALSANSAKSANLIDLLNEGLRTARGKWVGFLRPGVRLQEGWDRPIEEAFEDLETAAVAPLLLQAQHPNQIAAAGVDSDRRFNRQLVACGKTINQFRTSSSAVAGPTCWAAFYRRSILNALGEGDSSLDPVYFDLDLALSIQAMDLRCVSAPQCQLLLDDPSGFDAEKTQPHGCSAQRAAVRFSVDPESEPADHPASLWPLVWGMVRSLWRPGAFRHVWGRRRATQYIHEDRVHRDLLKILAEQKSRLIAPGLHLHVANHQNQQLRAASKAA